MSGKPVLCDIDLGGMRARGIGSPDVKIEDIQNISAALQSGRCPEGLHINLSDNEINLPSSNFMR